MLLIGFLPSRTHYIEVEASNISPEASQALTVKEYAKQQVLATFGNEWAYFNDLIVRESGWRSNVKNPKSSAYGLCQTMMSLHGKDLVSDFRTNPYAQIDWCVKYTRERYKTPTRAIQFHNANNYF